MGVAFTGSGKTIVFALPMVLQALEAELRLPLARGEGPVALMVCPSRELCAQTHAVVAEFAAALAADGYPSLRTLLLTGGLDMREQNDVFYALFYCCFFTFYDFSAVFVLSIDFWFLRRRFWRFKPIFAK